MQVLFLVQFPLKGNEKVLYYLNENGVLSNETSLSRVEDYPFWTMAGEQEHTLKKIRELFHFYLSGNILEELIITEEE